MRLVARLEKIVGFAVVLGVLTVAAPAEAVPVVTVTAIVTPTVGGFLYQYEITNDLLEDLLLVFIVVPVADPSIDPTLIVPAGFLGNYDDGLGFVDFLSDTALFPAGGTVSGFSFESAYASGPTTFTALTVFGNEVAGATDGPVSPAIPEPVTGVLLIIGLGVAAGHRVIRKNPGL